MPDITPTKTVKIKKGGNQYQADPRQQLFLAKYLDPSSDTFSNALQSALSAGYSQEYAESIMAQKPEWLSDNLGDLSLLSKAIKNIEEVLNTDTYVQAIGAFGPIFEKDPETGEKKPVMVINPRLLKIKADTSEFVASRLAKKRFGGDKTEEFGGGGTVNNITQIIIHPPSKKKHGE